MRKLDLCCFDLVIGEGVVGELCGELLSADGGLNVGVDAGQVRPVAGSSNPPVLEVPDAPLDTDPDPGKAAVEVPFDAAQVDVGSLLDRRVHDVKFTFVTQVTNSSTRPAHQVHPAGFPEAVHVMPAPRKGPADGQEPAVEIDQKLHVHAVATMLTGPQIFPMTPADSRDEGAVDQADPAGDQHGQVGWSAAPSVSARKGWSQAVSASCDN